MPRYPKEQKARTREQIVAAASRAFRAEGIAEVSIPGLMGRLGLTHGGFYAHFASKDALVAEACARPLLNKSAALAALPPGDAALRDVIAVYLSPRQRDNPAESCPLPSLSGELARAAPEARRAFTEALRGYLDRVAALLPAEVASRAPDQEIALVAGMVGAVLLARAVDDPELSDRLLAASRQFALAAFAGEDTSGSDASAGANP